MPARCIRQHRTPATPPKAFHEEYGLYFPEVDKTCVAYTSLAYSQDCTKISGEWKFVL